MRQCKKTGFASSVWIPAFVGRTHGQIAYLELYNPHRPETSPLPFCRFSIIMQCSLLYVPTFLLFPVPTYDYHCDACSYEFEEFQYIKDAPLKKCPQCGKNKLRRLIRGGAAVVFQGSGFYQTDYRSDSYRNAAKADVASKPASTTASPCKSCAAANECKVKN